MTQTKIKLRQLLIEIGNAVTHGLGALLAIVGLVILLVHTAANPALMTPMRIVAFSIYGFIMIIFYLASTLFHSLYFTRARHVFQVLDHSMIYLMIAGCYTPYCLVAIGGWLGWTLLSIIWVMAIAGVVYKSLYLNQKSHLSTLIYVIMGWMCLFALVPLYHALGTVGFGLLFAGGVVYTLGALLYSFPTDYTHLIWHCFVMVGSSLMYFSILFYV